MILLLFPKVALLVYARIDPVKDALASQKGPTEWVPLFSGPYQDFTEQWFAVVGAQIIVTVTLNILLPLFPLLNAFSCFCFCITRGQQPNEYHQRARTCNQEIKTKPPHGICSVTKGDFSLAERYGVSLMHQCS